MVLCSLSLLVLTVTSFKDEMVGHGFRHMASTRLRELGWPREVVEAQLSHKVGGTEGVYNMAEYLPKRREMMQAWADYLDFLRDSNDKNPTDRMRGPYLSLPSERYERM